MAVDRDLSSPIAWRRSLRASRARRARRERRRRLASRGRAGVVLVVATTTVAAGGALAQDASKPRAQGARVGGIGAVQQKLGIAADGVYGPATRAAVRRFQSAHGLAVDGIVGPQTLAALGLSGAATAAAPEAQSAPTSSSATRAGIARCESGGDPSAVSADGRYRGKYQFTRATWGALGGSGDPAGASEAEQDMRAARLLASSGTTPWPACGGRG